ncbi:E3 ubiquitin/ISG15 ligase TRIM25-like isoform X1, partial [Clarias magur]
VFFRMSKLSPLSISSTESRGSENSSSTPRHKRDSDMSDESEDSRYLNVSEHPGKINHSPAASYISMKSDQLMNAPQKFRHEPEVTPTSCRDELSPCPTVASFHSMDPPIKFISSDPRLQTWVMMNEISPGPTPDKSDQTVVPSILFKYRDPHTCQMMREHLRCTECKDVLKDPVSIPCGHSFCKSCILFYWTRPNQLGNYSCPQCRKRFTTRPELNLNVTLANVVQTHQRAGFSPAVPAQSYAGPGDVTCDICTRSKIRAVKTCRTCSVSYCEAHVRKHYTVEALQKHVLLEPTKDLEQGGDNRLGKANTSDEVTVSKDLMSNLMKQMNQLQNHVNDMALELEDMQRSKTEDEPPRKRSRAQLQK